MAQRTDHFPQDDPERPTSSTLTELRRRQGTILPRLMFERSDRQTITSHTRSGFGH